MCENDFDALNRLVGHERDRQTDGRTDGAEEHAARKVARPKITQYTINERIYVSRINTHEQLEQKD